MPPDPSSHRPDSPLIGQNLTMSKLPQDPMRANRFRMPRTIVALVLREMATTHGRSPGGYVWAVLEPVAALIVMTVVFW